MGVNPYGQAKSGPLLDCLQGFSIFICETLATDRTPIQANLDKLALDDLL